MTRHIMAYVVLAAFLGACATPPAEVNPNAPGGFHIVQAGDTFESIAGQHQVDTASLLLLNKLPPEASLRAGQPLALPAPGTISTSGAPPAAASTAASAGPAAPAAPVAPAAEATRAAEAVEPAAGGTAPLDAPSVDAPIAAASPTVEVRPAPPSPLSAEWLELQRSRINDAIQGLRDLYTDTLERPYGIVIVALAGLVGAFVAFQVALWLGKELVLALLPLARRLQFIGHELVLNVWYAAWWAGLAFYVPAEKGWRLVRPWVEPRARALAELARERGTVWSRRTWAWLQEHGRQAAIAIRDEAIDALEELALKRPILRGVADRLQSLAYQRETHALRTRVPGSPTLEVWPPAETALIAAMKSGSIAVHFTPVLGVGEAVAALDASLRWSRPDGTVVGDARLASAIERPGYTQAQRASLELVLGDAARRVADASEDGPRSVVVNIGRPQFSDPTLFAILRRVLQQTSVPPEALELSVDERAILADLDAASEVLGELNEFGVRTSVRDFGALTGEQLGALQVSGVSIDFWNSRRDERVSRYVSESVRTARQAGLVVTADRAEMPEEIEFARSLGCERLTGPRAEAPPAPAEERPASTLPSDDAAAITAAA
ncbi:MAG: EAL domain-containing protein [Dehalococcoidia bacterium]|nr:EAL domain-containing protein [Dehalococcoidia bacterium]